MQVKVYQTHIANIDELKHWLVQVWVELDHRHLLMQLSDSGDAISMRVARVWKLNWDILNNICIALRKQFHWLEFNI